MPPFQRPPFPPNKPRQKMEQKKVEISWVENKGRVGMIRFDWVQKMISMVLSFL